MSLLTVPPLNAMKLWGELLECYHRVNGYGGHTAEIYAYRLMSYSPKVHDRHYDKYSTITTEQAVLICRNAARALHEMVIHFCADYGCTATIDGLSPGDWLERVRGAGGFDHRAHVRIFKETGPSWAEMRKDLEENGP